LVCKQELLAEQGRLIFFKPTIQKFVVLKQLQKIREIYFSRRRNETTNLARKTRIYPRIARIILDIGFFYVMLSAPADPLWRISIYAVVDTDVPGNRIDPYRMTK